MELRHLRCFLTVANALSFRRAAAQLGTMPSSVSRTIAVLEDELGVELFGRSGRGAQLTQVGRPFHRDAQAIVAAVDRARETAGPVDRKSDVSGKRVAVRVDPGGCRI